MFRSSPHSPCHFFVEPDELEWDLHSGNADEPQLAMETYDVKHGVAKFEVDIERSGSPDIDDVCESLDSIPSNDAPGGALRQRMVEVGLKEAIPAIESESVDDGTKRSQIVFSVSLKSGVYRVRLQSEARESVFDWWRPRFERLVRSFRLAA